MIKNKKDVFRFMSHLYAHQKNQTFQTQQGVYVYDPRDNQYGYRGYQDVATSWYKDTDDFFSVVWRDRKEINNQEKEEAACAVSENK